MDKGINKRHTKVEKFKEPIIRQASSEYGSHYNLVHCANCDHLAHFKVSALLALTDYQLLTERAIKIASAVA